MPDRLGPPVPADPARASRALAALLAQLDQREPRTAAMIRRLPAARPLREHREGCRARERARSRSSRAGSRS